MRIVRKGRQGGRSGGGQGAGRGGAAAGGTFKFYVRHSSTLRYQLEAVTGSLQTRFLHFVEVLFV